MDNDSSNNGIVTLSWLPPVSSDNYCISNECSFEYTITLTNDTSDSITLYTRQTSLNITRMNITSHGLDPCVNYTWSVSARTDYKDYETSTVNSNESIVLQQGILL